MITWDRVDLPEPFGPMMACTSPERTVRSMPLRISLPATPARRAVISSSAIVDHHLDLTVDDPGLVHRHRLGGRERFGLAGLQGERAAVLPALDELLVAVDVPLRQRDVLVAAPVADRVDVVADAHDRHHVV